MKRFQGNLTLGEVTQPDVWGNRSIDSPKGGCLLGGKCVLRDKKSVFITYYMYFCSVYNGSISCLVKIF